MSKTPKKASPNRIKRRLTLRLNEFGQPELASETVEMFCGEPTKHEIVASLQPSMVDLIIQVASHEEDSSDGS